VLFNIEKKTKKKQLTYVSLCFWLAKTNYDNNTKNCAAEVDDNNGNIINQTNKQYTNTIHRSICTCRLVFRFNFSIGFGQLRHKIILVSNHCKWSMDFY